MGSTVIDLYMRGKQQGMDHCMSLQYLQSICPTVLCIKLWAVGHLRMFAYDAYVLKKGFYSFGDIP